MLRTRPLLCTRPILRTRRCSSFALLFTASLLILFQYSITVAAPLAEELAQESPANEQGGQEYVVQRGDWLSRISLEFYGSTSAWQIIVDATNERAETDSRFASITDPDEIVVGQRLWIPDPPAESESEADSSDEDEAEGDEAAVVGTATLTESVTLTDTVILTDTTGAISGTVRFAEPQNGDVVPERFDVVMAADALLIEPAGEVREGAGHFHILVDTDFVPAGELLPFDENHIHFGQGEMTTTLELEPGVHTLRLQFANGAHIALEGEQYRDTITVTVESGASATSTIARPTALATDTTDTDTPDTGTTSVTTSVTTPVTTPSTATPNVRFVEPQNGDVVPEQFDVVMEAEGLTIEPAGEVRGNAGHFHILVDTDLIPPGELLPFDENHLHFGRGELTTTLELEPGIHTLHLQFGDGSHIALEGEQYVDTITVTVTAE